MRCLTVLSICIFTFSFASCVPKSEYEKLQAENESIKLELNEQKFGAGRLLKEANAFFLAQQWEQAELKLHTLLEKHSDKTEAIEAQKLLSSIQEKKKMQAENEAWSRAQGNDELYLTQSYLDTYPAGQYVKEATLRLGKLKQKQHDDAYEYAINSENASTLKQFLLEYPDDSNKETIKRKLIQAEVAEIMRGDHGELPTFTPRYASGSPVSNVAITNQTAYTLTVRYSGPDVKMIDIPAGSTRSVSLSSGTYSIAASVSASNVRNFAGTQSLSGEYTENYYISTSLGY